MPCSTAMFGKCFITSLVAVASPFDWKFCPCLSQIECVDIAVVDLLRANTVGRLIQLVVP